MFVSRFNSSSFRSPNLNDIQYNKKLAFLKCKSIQVMKIWGRNIGQSLFSMILQTPCMQASRQLLMVTGRGFKCNF